MSLINNKFMDKLSLAIDELFLYGKEKIQSRKEIKKINIIDQFNKDSDGNISRYVKYIEFLLKDEFLNEKDIDLLDIEISYKKYNDERIEIKGEFYASDGKIFDEFYLIDNLEIILNEIKDFIYRCYMKCDEIIDVYVN
jgi:hypothetical protein